MGLALCRCVFISFEALFLCRPLAYTWDKTPSGSCVNLKTTILSQAAVNIFIDIAIVVLPMKELWGLQMQLVRKVWQWAPCLVLVLTMSPSTQLIFSSFFSTPA